jgi:hypothetical protein
MATSSIPTRSIITFGVLFIALVAVIALLYYCIPRSSSATQAPAVADATHQAVATEEEEAFSNYASAQLDQQSGEAAGASGVVADVTNQADSGANEQTAVQASESVASDNETPYPLESGADSGVPTDPNSCFPKNTQLQPEELLPADANSQWAQSCPAGQGSIGDQNFLTAGHHTGINTVGNSLRNANLQLRSEPPNPQVSVGPWNTSTISPDLNRRPLEVGGC